MPNPVEHFEIAVCDAAQGREFYSQLFDWEIKLDPRIGNYAELNPGVEGSIRGGIFAIEEGKFQPYVTFYVTVDDLAKYLDKAQSLGGKTIMPPMPLPGIGSAAMFADPDGNVIGLFSRKEM
ncbi:MAG: VOC family protein [Calditrichota bacterium]